MARRGLAVAAALLVGLSGCHAAAASSPTGTAPAGRPSTARPSVESTAPSSSAAAQRAVSAGFGAARTADGTGWADFLSSRDPSFGDRGRLLYDNLRRLPLRRLSVRLAPSLGTPLPASRRSLLGPDAWVQPADLTWALLGERRTVTQRVWLTLVAEAGTVRLAGTVDGPSGSTASQPLWWLGPVSSARRGPVVAMVGAGQSAPDWLAQARTAAAAVTRQLPTGTGTGWTGTLVLEVPATLGQFETVAGAAPGSLAGLAALTVPEGSATGALRVLVNPLALTRISALGRAAVLAHETTHVATDAPASHAPLWAAEGLAEYVAYRAYPAARTAAESRLLTRVRGSGPPSALPTDADFAGSADEVELAYAEAGLVARYVARRFSAADLGRFYARLDAGAGVDAAARSVLHVSGAQLVAGWRAFLEQQAGG